MSPERYDELWNLDVPTSDIDDLDLQQLEREFIPLAWEELLDLEYPRVVDALRDGFGDDSELFVSLWLSPDTNFAGWRTFPAEVRDDVLNEDVLIGGKPAAYSWLSAHATYTANW